MSKAGNGSKRWISKKRKKIKVSEELKSKIINLHHEEFLESGEIAQVLSIPEFIVAYVISPNY